MTLRIFAQTLRPDSIHISRQSGDTLSESVGLDSAFSQVVNLLGSFSVESASTCDYFEITSFSARCSVLVGGELTLAECIERRGRSLRHCNIVEWAHRQDLAQKERELGKRHPDTLADMNKLALVLSGQGNHTAAEALHKETLNLREMVLGEDHSLTLASRNNLALALSGQEKHAEAEQVHRDTLRAKARVLGQHHIGTLISLHNLAQTLSHQRRYTDALPLYEKAYTGCSALLGLNDPITQACLDHYTAVQQAACSSADAA